MVVVMMGKVKRMFESLFGPMVEALEAELGVTFQLWDTGGGCTALVGELEGDVSVYVTDAPTSPNGEEATISDMLIRRFLGEDTIGYAIGVYRSADTVLAYEEFPTATVAELPVLVTGLLRSVIRGETPS